MAKNQFHENCKFLVSSILKKDKINWPKEIKIAQKLLNLYPEIKFWEELYLDTYPNSLCVFLTDSGQKLLKKEHDTFLLTKSEKIEIEEKPVVILESIEEKKNPKTLQEFIDEQL